MGLIPNEIINAVIERSDIVETIGRYVLLKKAGRNFKALCPFHHEKSPSFVVNPDKQIFHCFGCGAGGNSVGFIMRQERLEFPDAVRFLADHCGITIPQEGQAESPSRQLRDDIYKANDLAAGYFHDILLNSRELSVNVAREYLKGRGIDLETVKQFRLGFAPDGWDGLIEFLKTKHFSLELMEQAGLIIPRTNKSGFYDRFRNRVMFPIFDIQSRSVAFGARAMGNDEGAKYINSPETPVYTKGRHLFGLNLTKTAVGKLDEVIVVEGYMDMIMPFVYGVENITASLGTALTVEQIRLIRRYTTNVVMLFDTDPAGQNAIVRSLDLLVEEGMNVRVVTLADGQDPDSFIRSEGIESFRRRLSESLTLFDFKIKWLEAQLDSSIVQGPQRVSKICQGMLATINRYKDEVIKFELTKVLAQKFNIPLDVLLKQASQSVTKSTTTSSFEQGQALPMDVKPSANLVRSEEMLLALFLSNPQWVLAAQRELTPEDFADGVMREIIRQLWQLSNQKQDWSVSDLLALLNDPLAQSCLTRLLSQNEDFLIEPQRLFDDCIGRIRRERQKIEKRQLMEALRQAEVRGDEIKIEELRQQFNVMIKQ